MDLISAAGSMLEHYYLRWRCHLYMPLGGSISVTYKYIPCFCQRTKRLGIQLSETKRVIEAHFMYSVQNGLICGMAVRKP